MKEFLTEQEVADYLAGKGVALGVMWLRKKRVQGDGIPFVKFGPKVRYRRETVERWLAGHGDVSSTSEVAA